MSNKNIEQHIINAAKELFFAKGKFNATSQEIADYANVPRTSINYYFRSSKILYAKVKDEALRQSKDENDKVLLSDLPFKEKVSKLIDSFTTRLESFPYLEGVIMNENNVIDKEKMDDNFPIFQFLKEIKSEMERGTIVKSSPKLFLINLFSLLVYPYLVQNLNKEMLNISEAEYKKLMKQRKKIILEMLFPQNKIKSEN